jgi:4-hydroxy-2-oxoglutarate aldolase
MIGELNGIYPAMITPFDQDDRVDATALKANIKRWNEYGLRGYLALGSTGEAPFLEGKERDLILETVRKTMVEGMTLLVGAGRESTTHTIKTCKWAANSGADAVLVLTPGFYNPLMTAEALEKHYLAVAEACPVPVILYMMPVYTGVTIPLETVIKLARHPNIAGMKDSSGNGQFLGTIIRNTPDDFYVFSGHAPSLVQALMTGAAGAILAVANVVPEICVALYRASEAHNFTEVQHLHNLLQPIAEVVGGTYGIGGLKYAMSLLGYAAGSPRSPLSSPTPNQAEQIETALQTAALLETPN